jgi:chromosome segregation ATPase
MIEVSMYVGTGFLLAFLSTLILLPLVHGRAVRLTTRRLEGRIPSSMAEILADKDLLRAEFSMATRRFEAEIERLRTKDTRQVAEIGRKNDSINSLKRELGALQDEMRPDQEQFAINSAALEKTKRALLASESELVCWKQEVAELSTAVEVQKTEIGTLKQRVEDARRETNAAEHQRYVAAQEAERLVAEKDSELAKRKSQVADWVKVAERRRLEIATLKNELEDLKARLNEANNQLHAAEHRHNTAAQQAARTLAERASELGSLAEQLSEKTNIAESQTVEISLLKGEMGVLKVRLGSVIEELKQADERRHAAAQEVAHALAGKEADLANLTEELLRKTDLADSRSVELRTLKNELETLKERFDGVNNELNLAEKRGQLAAQDAARSLAGKDSELSKLVNELSEKEIFADGQRVEICALKGEVDALKVRLDDVSKELDVSERGRRAAAQEAERMLAEKESQMSKQVQELSEYSTLDARQKSEIMTLEGEVKTLQERLGVANAESKMLSEHHRTELSLAVQKLMDQTEKFKKFRLRVAELVQEARLERDHDKALAAQAHELGERLEAQSRIIDEREAEVRLLRDEIQIARNAEADLRANLTRLEDSENVFAQSLAAEKARWQATLERANGERVRLAYEVSDLKRRLEQKPYAQNASSIQGGETAEEERAA